MTHPPMEIFRDMDHQPKYEPQHMSPFFADGRGGREIVTGTVPLGYTLENRYFQTAATNDSNASGFPNKPDYFNTGTIDGFYGDGIPASVPVTAELIERGRSRFDINCEICHGRAATGDGIVKTFGLATVASLQDERIRTMPDGQIFNTITHGKNTMGAYGPQIAVQDRWAIISYLRALQKSQNVQVSELSAATQTELNAKP